MKNSTTKNTATNAISNSIPALTKLLKRKDGVSVPEAVDSLGICKKSVRKLLAAAKAKEGEYLGYYVA